MRILHMSKDGDSADLAARAYANGHDVKFYVNNPEYADSFQGLIPKVDKWKPHVAWADFIMFDHTGMSDIWKQVVKEKPCFGGSEWADKLEKDRPYAKDIFKKIGLTTFESIKVNTLDEAIKHVSEHKVKHVVKPVGKNTESYHVTIGEYDDGKDVVETLNSFKDMDLGIKYLEIEEKKTGIEVGVSGWFIGDGKGGGDWSGDININFEHKRLATGYPEGMGPLTGEMGCYDEETEVLTKDGWKFWRDVVKSDEIATLINGELQYEIPSALVHYDVDTHLIGWKNRTIDILVTPNHNMYVSGQGSSRKKKPEFKFIAAEDCNQSQYLIPRKAKWNRKSKEYFTVPSYRHVKGNGYQTHPEIKIDMIDWARFIGIYVAEGFGGVKGNQISIAQSHPVKSNKVEEIIKPLPFKYTKYKNGFRISNTQLSKCFRGLGRAPDKHVPQYIKDSGGDVITAFLEGYCLGDGNMQPNGFRVFYTCSKRLADDVQELLLKIGRVGIIKVRSPRKKNSYINGRLISSNRPQYEITERIKKGDSWIDIRDKYTKKYKGRVYCATVSSHVLYVRRNGKAVWCGNTGMVYDSRNNQLFKKTLDKIKPILQKENYRGQIDISFIVNDEGIFPLEATPRLGYPACFIEQQMQTVPFEDLFYETAKGNSSFQNRNVPSWAIGVVVVTPGFPSLDEAKKRSNNLPIFGWEKYVDQVHLIEAKAGKDHEGKETILTDPGIGYPMVITGLGKTIEEAKRSAYKVLSPDNKERAYIPNMIYRTDIGDRVIRQKKDLLRLGILPGNLL